MNRFSIRQSANAEMKIQTEIVDSATGQIIKRSPVYKNTVMNAGLNALAGGVGFSNFFLACKIGSSATGNFTHNPAVTFLQTGATITASSSFFNAGMVGWLFKYGTGTGGAEYYITAYISATQVTVDTSATVASPLAGTVWNVNQTALGSYLYTSSTYNSGGYVIVSPGVIQLQRVCTFASQSSPYSVNEIGYSSDTGDDGNIYGRVVLGSTDVVGPSSFYVVTMTITYTVAPCAASVSFSNTGTNFDNSGQGIYAFYSCQIVLSNGTTGNYQGNVAGFSQNTALMDSVSVGASVRTATFSLPSAISTGAATLYNSGYLLGNHSFVNTGGVGISLASGSYSINTAGETCYGFYVGAALGFGSIATNEFQLLLTNPQSLPNGQFSGTWSWQNIFTRTLTNP